MLFAALLGIFVAKLLSPTVFVPAANVGWFSKAWWHVFAGAIIPAIITEVALSMMQRTRVFDFAVFLTGYFAAVIWAAGVFYFRVVRKRRNATGTQE